MSLPDFRSLASALLPAVISAGRVEMAYYESGVVVERKSDTSPVTAADREAEEILVAAIQKALPGVPVIAEESAAAGHLPETGSLFFLVDPLDGTREFIKKNGDFTINIGLVQDGVPVFGLIYAPAMDQFFVTLGPDEAAESTLAPQSMATSLADLDLKPLAARRPPSDGLVALESRSHRSPETSAFLANLPIASVRSAGSSLKFCLIARGEADLYPRIGPTCEWDTAAGHAILNAAGGKVVQVDGSPFVYGKSAAKYLNPHFTAWGKPA